MDGRRYIQDLIEGLTAQAEERGSGVPVLRVVDVVAIAAERLVGTGVLRPEDVKWAVRVASERTGGTSLPFEKAASTEASMAAEPTMRAAESRRSDGPDNGPSLLRVVAIEREVFLSDSKLAFICLIFWDVGFHIIYALTTRSADPEPGLVERFNEAGRWRWDVYDDVGNQYECNASGGHGSTSFTMMHARCQPKLADHASTLFVAASTREAQLFLIPISLDPTGGAPKTTNDRG